MLLKHSQKKIFPATKKILKNIHRLPILPCFVIFVQAASGGSLVARGQQWRWTFAEKALESLRLLTPEPGPFNQLVVKVDMSLIFVLPIVRGSYQSFASSLPSLQFIVNQLVSRILEKHCTMFVQRRFSWGWMGSQWTNIILASEEESWKDLLKSPRQWTTPRNQLWKSSTFRGRCWTPQKPPLPSLGPKRRRNSAGTVTISGETQETDDLVIGRLE